MQSLISINHTYIMYNISVCEARKAKVQYWGQFLLVMNVIPLVSECAFIYKLLYQINVPIVITHFLPLGNCFG